MILGETSRNRVSDLGLVHRPRDGGNGDCSSAIGLVLEEVQDMEG